MLIFTAAFNTYRNVNIYSPLWHNKETICTWPEAMFSNSTLSRLVTVMTPPHSVCSCFCVGGGQSSRGGSIGEPHLAPLQWLLYQRAGFAQSISLLHLLGLWLACISTHPCTLYTADIDNLHFIHSKVNLIKGIVFISISFFVSTVSWHTCWE